MKNTRMLWLATLLAATPGHLLAEELTSSSAMARFGRELARQDVNAEGVVASGRPELSLEATEIGGSLAATIGLKTKNDLTSLILQLAAPLDKGADKVELANLVDLPSGTAATLGVSHSLLLKTARSKARLDQQKRLLYETALDVLPAESPVVVRAKSDSAIDPNDFLRAAAAEGRQRLFRIALRATPTQLFFSGKLQVSDQDFKFIADPPVADPATHLIATTTTDELNKALRLGVSIARQGSLFSLGWARKEVWKARPTGQFCVSSGNEALLTCTSAALGPPTKGSETVLSVEWKRKFTTNLALQAQLFWAEETDTLNPHLITYFIPQTKDQSLRGGLDFSYLSNHPEKGDEFGVRLFVGVPFSLKN